MLKKVDDLIFMKWSENDERYVLSSNDTTKIKATKTGHSESSVKMRLANALYVITNGKIGLSNYSKQTKVLVLEIKMKNELCNYLKSRI